MERWTTKPVIERLNKNLYRGRVLVMLCLLKVIPQQSKRSRLFLSLLKLFKTTIPIVKVKVLEYLPMKPSLKDNSNSKSLNG